MKTLSKTSKLMKPSTGRRKNPTLEQVKADTKVAAVDWLPHNRGPHTRKFTLVGYNSHGFKLDTLGTVEPSKGDGWVGHRSDGGSEAFNKAPQARMYVADGWPNKRPTTKNPKLWDRAKELAKDAVHAVTQKRKSAAALKRLREASGPNKNPEVKPASASLVNKYKWHSSGVLREMLLLPPQQVSTKAKQEIQRVIEFRKRRDNPRRRRNPEESALETFELFHGVPSKEVIEFQTRFHVHENLAGLGQLTELVFFTPGAKPERVVVEAEDLGDGVWLCCSEDGKQLYILGEAVIDLEALGYRPDVDIKDCVELGRLTNVVYRTQKEFHDLKMLDYDHRLGKREKWQKSEGVGPDMNKAVAECPVLAYYTRENRLAVVGGQYLILREGITN